MPALRSLLLSLASLLASACTVTPTTVETTAPTLLTVGTPNLRSPAIGLPFHRAAIVDVALLSPHPGEQWRLASGDADGWVRIWADGKLLAVWHAHPGGLSDLQLATDGRWYTAGVDGHVLEWWPDQLGPVRSLTLAQTSPTSTQAEQAKQPGKPKPITALAVAGPHLAISDGRYIQFWSRDAAPQLLWTGAADGFVTGLALSSTGGVVAAAELRQQALREGSATHPLARFDDGPRAVTAEQQAQLRAAAERDFPQAAADYIEVWQPGRERSRVLEPRAPIDRDLGVLTKGGVVYREIYGQDSAGLMGRRLEDLAHFPLQLVKPWVFWTQANGQPTDASLLEGNPPAGDFRLGPADEILVLDLFPGWGSAPPERGWRVGDRRELAIDQHHAAVGDGQGNLAVIAWARPAEAGWQAAAEQRIDLLAGARGQPEIVTATLEPRTDYRLWSLATGMQRIVRVEAPWHVLPADEQRKADPAAGEPMYPAMLALDAAPLLLVTSLSSFGADLQTGVRVLRVPDGAAQVLTLATGATSLDVGISPDAAYVLTWAPGAAAHSWQPPNATRGWTAGPDAIGGVPRFSANGRYSAHVSGFERHIVDLQARKPVVSMKAESAGESLGEGTVAAIADDGTLALVQPFGGGTLERIAIGEAGGDKPAAGVRTMIELPGAATALAWVPTIGGASVLLVGFADGTIARVDGVDVQPIHAGGGRIWELVALGGPSNGAGVYVELDDRGLTLHRLVDEATLELYLSDTTTLERWDGSGIQAAHNDGLVAIWRPATATPPCLILDGTSAGVLADPSIERWSRERAGELFERFLAGSGCTPTPEPQPASP